MVIAIVDQGLKIVPGMDAFVASPDGELIAMLRRDSLVPIRDQSSFGMLTIKHPSRDTIATMAEFGP